MSVLPVPILRDAVDDIEWLPSIAGLHPPACSEASSALYKAAREAETRGETKLVSVLDLLGIVCRFRLKPEHDDVENGPYEAHERKANGEDLLPTELSGDELNALAAMLDQGALPSDLAARLCDILVIGKKDYRRAREAIDHYLAAAEELAAADAAHLTPSRLQRAAQLAARFGSKKGDDVERVVLTADSLLRDPASSARGRSTSILDAVLDRQHPDPCAFATLIEELAREEEAGGDPFTAKGLWHRAGRAWQKAGDDQASHTAYVEAAECHVRIAESGPGGAFRATHLESAIKAYQKVPGSQDRRTELRRLMLASQKVAIEEMGQISSPFDVSDAAAAAAEQVQGLPWLSAVFEMALGVLDPHAPDEMEDQTIEMAQATPFMTLIGATFMNEHGRTVAKKPDGFSDEEGALRAEVQRHAALTRQFDIPGRIRPARSQILRDHGDQRRAFEALAAQASFVPPGRAKMFGRALAAGIEGDFVVSTYLLPPLIEHAVLVLLLRRGVVSGPLTEDEASRRYGLNATLRGDLGDAVATVLGADVHFTLSALLVDRFGSNAWPDPPARWSHSSLTRAEACPLRWSFSRARYTDGTRGFPERPSLAALKGQVVHGAVDEVLGALAAAGCRSVDSAEAAQVLLDLGGITSVTERHVEAVLADLPDHERAARVAPTVARSLRQDLHALRDRFGPFVRRARLGPRGAETPARSSGAPAHSDTRRALGPGSHTEVWVECPDPPFGGRVDVLSLSPDDVEIADVKTGRPSAAHADQLVTYGVLWLRDRVLNPEGRPPTSLTILYPSESVPVPLPDWDAASAALASRARSATEAVGARPVPAVPDPDTCRWCDAKPACPAYWASTFVEQDPAPFFDVGLVTDEERSPDVWSVSIERCPSRPDLVGPASLVTRAGGLFQTGQHLRILGARLLETDPDHPGVVLATSESSEVFLTAPAPTPSAR